MLEWLFMITELSGTLSSMSVIVIGVLRVRYDDIFVMPSWDVKPWV